MALAKGDSKKVETVGADLKKADISGNSNDNNKEISGVKRFFSSNLFKLILSISVFLVLLFGVYYLQVQESRIYIENAAITAPVIELSSNQPGILDKIYVKEGDFVSANTIVARVGNVTIKSKIEGLIIYVKNTPGQYVTQQSPIVKMIDINELRVVGQVEENKGLSDIKEGQKVEFTVDAFGSKKYVGTVDTIAPSARSGDLVFSISDKRQEQQFNINIIYSVPSYPELKQGMSAKMWIYK